ncbi:MAG TPA: aspartate kinase [Bacteroidales bacterium]|nr:MAG: aspartate kinase [Bacteroidetes bacterium GWE2_42_24]OFY25670.1 MAG: aspartate kinase [Bacteroidetes bacterium GWF2_43_11]HAQ64589.1 aspartate kinase [Bacteroidales bacterium]HBZ68070.1 aspartate kinase [Bacteroidales bacterium]
MQTIANIIENVLMQYPFLWENLSDGLVNTSALARMMMPAVEREMGRPVKEAAVMMAIRRLSVQSPAMMQSRLNQFLRSLGDITVRSNLDDFTFRNSYTLAQNQARLLQEVSARHDLFITFAQGVNESTVIASTSIREVVEEVFNGEELLHHVSPLSSLTVRLPSQNMAVIGLYYQIFRSLAWYGINIVEVISTANEFTLILLEDQVDKAFRVIKDMKKGS